MGQINLLYVYVCGGGGDGGKNLVGEHGFPWCRDRGGGGHPYQPKNFSRILLEVIYCAFSRNQS